MYIKLDVVMIEIFLHLLTIDIEDIQVHDSQAASPSLIQISKIAVIWVEDAIEEGEVIFDLLVAFNVKASLRLGDSCIKIGHDEEGKGELVWLSRPVSFELKEAREICRKVNLPGMGAAGSHLYPLSQSGKR